MFWGCLSVTCLWTQYSKNAFRECLPNSKHLLWRLGTLTCLHTGSDTGFVICLCSMRISCVFIASLFLLVLSSSWIVLHRVTEILKSPKLRSVYEIPPCMVFIRRRWKLQLDWSAQADNSEVVIGVFMCAHTKFECSICMHDWFQSIWWRKCCSRNVDKHLVFHWDAVM